MFKEDDNKNKILPLIKQRSCYVIDCSENWKKNQKKLKESTCINSCEDDTTNKYEYNGKCVQTCSKGTLLNEPNKCKCESEKCLTCPTVALNKKLCTQCNDGYYPMEYDSSNLGEYINCYKEPLGYYLDKSDLIYKKCFYTCETCEKAGSNSSHNCLTCNSNYSLGFNDSNYINCYKNCSYYYYFDNENNFHCTDNSSCPAEYSFLVEERNECIRVDIKKYTTGEIILTEHISTTTIKTDNLAHDLTTIIRLQKYDKTIIEDILKIDNITEKEKVKYLDDIINTIETSFISDNFDKSNINNGIDDIIKTENFTITFTSTKNQKEQLKDNITAISLGECEIMLRKFYNLSANETIYIKKLDIYQNNMKIPKISYDVFSKISGTNLEKLNLSICGDNRISLSIPIIINENLDEFNSSSEYYNDICYSATSENGTDISLKDRKILFVGKDKTICQENCEFAEYNYTIKKANCSCSINQNSFSFVDMNINKTKLFENFVDFKNIANIKLLKCYKNLFSREGILKNVGSYIITSIFLFNIISIFIFNMNSIKKR